MKTFKTLKLGDIVYSFKETEITSKDFNITQTPVKNIKVNNEGEVIINPVSGSGYSSNGQLFELSDELAGKTSFQEPDYPKRVFFVNKEDANSFVRQYVIKNISELEASIPEFINRTNKTIEETRNRFYEILNTSHNPEFKIV